MKCYLIINKDFSKNLIHKTASKTVNNGRVLGTLITDPSKTSDCLQFINQGNQFNNICQIKNKILKYIMETVLQKKPFTIFCRVNPRSSYLRDVL